MCSSAIGSAKFVGFSSVRRSEPIALRALRAMTSSRPISSLSSSRDLVVVMSTPAQDHLAREMNECVDRRKVFQFLCGPRTLLPTMKNV